MNRRRRAAEILRTDGLGALGARSVAHAARVIDRKGVGPLAFEQLLRAVSAVPGGDEVVFRQSERAVRRRMATESSLEDVIDTVIDIRPGYGSYEIGAAQLREELRGLARLVAAHDPETVLEIGTNDGGTFYTWCRAVESAEQIVSLDLPGGEFGGGYDERTCDLFRTFTDDADLSFLRRDSHDPATLAATRDELNNPVDFLFIDGDHTYEGVKQDFEMYSDLVADGGIVAFHDIVETLDDPAAVERRRERVPDAEDRHFVWGEGHPDCNVHQFWEELSADYETETFVSHPEQTWGGIGVVFL
ncbi:MAG: class I SAM-dependent methyltransferase [Halobaculum sp.]